MAGAHHSGSNICFEAIIPSHIGNFIIVPDVSSGSLIHCRASVANKSNQLTGRHRYTISGTIRAPSLQRVSARPSLTTSGFFLPGNWIKCNLFFTATVLFHQTQIKLINLLSVQPLNGVSSLQQLKKITAIVASQFSPQVLEIITWRFIGP